MGFVDFVKSRISGDGPQKEVAGTIVEGPNWLDEGGTPKSIMTFRLDSFPDVEFRQVVSPLAPGRKKGDQVTVHYHEEKDGQHIVDWCEGG